MARTQQRAPQAPQVDAQQVADFTTTLKQAHGEFQAECTTKARKYRLYFVMRDRLKVTITSIRNLVPAGTKATPVPADVPPDAFRKLIDALAAAEKLLREEEKFVKADAAQPAPVKPPTTSGPTAAKRVSRRREARSKLKKLLKDIYGDKKGNLRYKVYEKQSKEAGRDGSPQAMWALFNGDTVEEQQALREATRVRRSGGAATATGSTGSAATDGTDPAAGAEGGASSQGAQAGGIVASLWPTDRPIYARPAVIVGGVLFAGVVGWLLLSGKPKSKAPAALPKAPAAPPALPPKREEKGP